MQVAWGNYRFGANSVFVGVRQSTVLNAADIPYLDTVEVDCQGRLYGTTQAECAVAEALLETALRIPFQNFALLMDNGQPSAISLVNAQTLGGVHCIKGPDFLSKSGSEYVNQREFSFTIRAVYPITNLATALISFSEEMTYDGGGAEYVERPAINGPAQIQLGWAQRAFTLTQTGEAVGFRSYPTPPNPAFLPLQKSPRIRKMSPKRIGNNFMAYPIRWEYSMISNNVINALPTLWR